MSDGFDTQLADMFAAHPELPDAEVFAQRVEDDLKREGRWLVIGAMALGLFVLGVCFPLLGGVLEEVEGSVTALMEQSSAMASGFATITMAVMALILTVAGVIGWRQAARL
jgi:hypothetical protein